MGKMTPLDSLLLDAKYHGFVVQVERERGQNNSWGPLMVHVRDRLGGPIAREQVRYK